MDQKKSTLLTLGIIAASASCIALLFYNKPSPQKKDTRPTGISVSALTAKYDFYTPSITLFGVIASKHVSELSSATAAHVLLVPVNEGQKVRKDELLVQLDERDTAYALAGQQATSQQIEAELANLQLDLERNKILLLKQEEILKLTQKRVNRQEQLLKNNLSSSASRDAEAQQLLAEQIKVENLQHEIESHANLVNLLQARLAASLAKEDSLKLMIERLTVRSPFKGIISMIDVSPGEHVVPGQRLLTLYDVDTLHAVAKIPASFEDTFKKALASQQKIVATTADQSLNLTFSYMSENIESGELGQKAYFTITNLEQAIHNDQVILQVKLPRQYGIAVPKQSLYDEKFIYTIIDNKLKSMSVRKLGKLPNGDHEESLILIDASGLQNGVLILKDKIPNLKDGTRVIVR